MGRTCIIGAGSSGVTVAKALKQAGAEFDVFEKGSNIGGMWRYENDNGQSSCYASLHIDTSRPNLGYSDFPIDPKLPDFLSHQQFLEHLERYAQHFDIPRHVTFGTRINSVVPKEGGYAVTLGSGESREYDRVVIATGHLSDPRMPDFPGHFDGETIHSHHYRTADPYIGKRVLVVGIGNSAVDIAVDLCRRAKHVTLSTRRSAWVMPKYLMGIPIDQWSGFLGRRLRLPTPAVRRIMAQLIKLGVGDQRRFGLPRPEHPMYREHATLSQDLLPNIGHGYIDVKPNVSGLNGARVAFEDGSDAPYDAIIFATGYKVGFPFLDRGVFDPDLQLGELYRRMVVPAHPGLIHAGLLQPVGPTIPLVETQGKWIAALASGRMSLPDRPTMDEEIRRHRDYQRRTYLDAPRYILEVDYKLYTAQMKSDMASGRAGT
ncbi:monooxygenase [Pseudooceanicola batsensis HTCC2597]|uniref:Trimethylamine monooxygenase n=1 Tax=Pseudooceanicola batsensis (strain ATCC BAA-863 / DSM 15984 / KCTC 12145 / HTCC2597) TaxID=252305 RepID=A3TUI9_PSEBH|nr:NAD(P)-binding domain-containing protein [Pseudooceanicola batsensis]EAQ04185.1 monooxygenase [Pseudooceanicola batsensis HTCC2597]